MDLRLHPYRVDFEPVALAGDYVTLLRGQDVVQKRVRAVYALPFMGEVDFGAVVAAATVGPAQALIGGVDIFQVGPDEFIQSRLELNPTDFTAQTMILGAYLPGPATAMWSTLGALANWNITAQLLWTSLHPTELFSYWQDTPQFAITNGSGGNMGTSRVRFMGWRYLCDPADHAPTATELTSAPQGRPIILPVAAQRGRTANVPAL